MPDSAQRLANVGVVVIGRNEGDRLRASLESVVSTAGKVVYVDSGSSDNSVEVARSLGAEVVELDMNVPFTAGRARNEGFRRLREIAPDVACVQFVDGDCEIDPNWLERGATFLDEHADVAVVFGRLRERHPEQSVYNMLCDIEWDTPAGQVRSCGGNALMRVAAFEQTGGFRPEIIAGEEPELCVRLRTASWLIWHLDDPMALHDACMTRFGQWWKRCKRAGYSFALGSSLHGNPPERHCRRESRSAWMWGVGVPVVAVLGAALVDPLALLVFSVYPLQVVRLALRGERSGRENWWRAVFLVIGKFPETLGQVRFLADRCFHRTPGLIEYK